MRVTSLTQSLNGAAAQCHISSDYCHSRLLKISTLIKNKYFWLLLPIAVIVSASLGPVPNASSALTA